MSPLRYSLRTPARSRSRSRTMPANFFANSARPDYALSTEQNLQRAKGQGDAGPDRRAASLAENAHRPMLLHSGLKIHPWSISASDMQLLDSGNSRSRKSRAPMACRRS
jgi:phage portal protein BeeE